MPVAKIDTSVQVAFLREDGCYIAYCPALDLSAYGDSMEDAANSFSITYKMFIEDLAKKGNLVDVLLDLGWNDSQVSASGFQISLL